MNRIYQDLTPNEFNQQYPLVENHINPAAGWAVANGGGCLFETYGEELDFVRRQDPRRIWTLIDDENGLYVASGMRFVNRLGYLISRIFAPQNAFIAVRFER